MIRSCELWVTVDDTILMMEKIKRNTGTIDRRKNVTKFACKNLALIDEAEVDFSGGLNILTGETGAGKSPSWGVSVLPWAEDIQQICFVRGADKGLVELTFMWKIRKRYGSWKRWIFRRTEGRSLSPDGLTETEV